MAEADVNGGRIIDEYVEFPAAVVEEGRALFSDRFKIFGDWRKSPYCREAAAYFGVSRAFSIICMTASRVARALPNFLG